MGRKRGAGSLYRQPGCKTWSIKFYQNGKCVRESTGLIDYQAARQKLNQEEMLNARVRQFNGVERTLDPGSTKNDDARHIVLTRECLELVKACVFGKSADDHILTCRDHN
jgi:hypothetical protein